MVWLAMVVATLTGAGPPQRVAFIVVATAMLLGIVIIYERQRKGPR
jgi:hypothetical protein